MYYSDINYPFDPLAMERQANFSNEAKSLGVKKTCICEP
jgi:hypothetical protein